MARIPLARSARVSPESLHPPLTSRAATGTVEVTLVLRHGKPLPTVEELCADPPRRHLTHDEFEATYGTTDKDLATVRRFAKTHGLRVLSEHRGLGLMRLAGPAKAVRDALGVALRRYTHGSLSYLSHADPVALPGSLRDVVEWVFGLDTRPLVTHSAASLPVPVRVAAEAGLRSYPATRVAELYRYPASQGEGQCVGIIELTGGYDPADLAAYLEWMGVEREPPVLVGPNQPRRVGVAANAEVTMDVELVASVCPKARVVVYNANSQDYSLSDYHRVFAQAISDKENRPSVLTTSWSFYEGSLIQQGDEAAFERLFRAAALLGITVCAASGDLGSQVPVQGGSPTDAITLAATSYPAASALVLGCGGTTLVSVGDSFQEHVWNRLGEAMSVGMLGAQAAAGASSGGVSAMNALPLYQQGLDVPHQVSTSWKGGVFERVSRTPGRGVPDVAANADLHTGYQIVFNGQRGVAAGTSAAAPMWAALVTLLNEALGERVGFLQPRLYALVSEGQPVVRRVTRGGNGAYFASADSLWNACTGLGTPDGQALLDGLRGQSRPRGRTSRAAR
jgi:kumamolisin